MLRRRRVTISSILAVLIVHLGPAQSSDGDLQRALLEANCVAAKLAPQPQLGKTKVYEANCFGSSHRKLKIVCTDGRCVADRPRAGQDDPGDRDLKSR